MSLNRGSLDKAIQELNVESLMFSYGGAKCMQFYPMSSSSLYLRDEDKVDNINLHGAVLTANTRIQSPIHRVTSPTLTNLDIKLFTGDYLALFTEDTATFRGLYSLKVKLDNQGGGADPIINSNHAEKMVTIDNRLLINGRVYFKDDTAYEAQIASVLTAARVFTFPDATGTVVFA